MSDMKVAVLVRKQSIVSKIRSITQDMEVELEFSTRTFEELLESASRDRFDMLIWDATSDELTTIDTLDDEMVDDGNMSLLLVVEQDMLTRLRLPVQYTCDFVCTDASDAEFSARIRRLLWPGEERGSNDFIRQGSLTLNLATYQVKVDDDPVDFTYLEYALLAFLITHPGRTYSRDALLNRVWDFDYYGGSRTVDVHVRRIRAKLGPDLAQHLKTVRGVGYLWSY